MVAVADAARGLTTGFVARKILYPASRLLIAFFRTVPDLVWALIFVITVGLGPFAGTLAMTIILMIFILVLMVERLGSLVRNRIIEGH